jgi:hypothetical protein
MKDELSRKEFSQYFTFGYRAINKGTFEEKKQQFSKLVECPPKELQELIRKIHKEYFCDCLPNDWVYETIHDAFLDLENDCLDDINLEADCYYHQLYEWLGNPYGHEYCNEVLEEFDPKDMYQIISAAQERAKDRIYREVDEFIKEE